eukprot:scaffold21740_cov53-Cyclotella_meneghiniana.AAC.1
MSYQKFDWWFNHCPPPELSTVTSFISLTTPFERNLFISSSSDNHSEVAVNWAVAAVVPSAVVDLAASDTTAGVQCSWSNIQ